MVIDQGTMLDRIDYNVERVVVNVKAAEKELTIVRLLLHDLFFVKMRPAQSCQPKKEQPLLILSFARPQAISESL